MLPVKFRLMAIAIAIAVANLAIVPSGVLRAQEAGPDRAATVADAARTINLENFPMMTGGTSHGPRRLASLSYAARADVRKAYAFQKETLETRGWKELPGGYLSDQSCSGTFGKDGFKVAVSTSPAYGPDAAGLVEISLRNLGNVDVTKLPVPPDATLLYSFPATTAYVTVKPVKETSEALRTLLTARGWEPYGIAGDSLYFKQNAVRLSAWPSAAPAQGGKTVIQFATELMSVDLPAPPALLDAAYADTTKALSLEVDMTPEALTAFYKAALGKAGWKATTDKPVKIDFREMLIFRNDAKDIATLKMHEFEGKLRANLDHQTAIEFDETMRQARAEESKRKAESAQYAKKAAEAAAKNRLTVAIAVPAGAKAVKRTKDRLEFKLAAGKAKAAVQTIRSGLLKAGWTGDTKVLEPLGGSVIIRKKAGATLAVVYVDTGFGDADIMISAIGVDIEEPKSK